MSGLTDSRPAVLHVTQAGDGGVGKVVAGLARFQDREGFRVEVACDPDSPLAAELAGAGLRVRPWVAARSPVRGVWREAASLSRIVEQARPDVVHAHSAKAGLVARLVVRGKVRTVFEPHAWSFWALPDWLAGVGRAWERAALRWTSRVICLSKAEAAAIDLGDRAALIPNGVDTDWWCPRDRAESRRRLGVDEDKFLVVCVARVCWQKGQDVLIDAFRLLLDEQPGALLTLVGDGPTLPSIRERAAGLPVLTPGQVADPRDWYAAADLVVLPSRYEGGALSVLEVGAMERLMVATSVGSVTDDPALAVLVPSNDPVRLAGVLGWLAEDLDLRTALARSARRRVLHRYQADEAYRRVTELAVPLSCASVEVGVQ